MGKLITIEGMSGMGKTYFFNKLKEEYKNNKKIVFNDEITDGNHNKYADKIFDILYDTKSSFFDLGNPKAETLLIAAKQAFDEEDYILKELNNNKIVISDRGFDTICILEGIMLSLKYNIDLIENVDKLYNILKVFNRKPDKTILLTGNKNKSIKRAQERDKKLYTEKEKIILNKSYELYNYYSNKFARFVIINRDKNENEVFNNIKGIIDNELEGR